MRDFDKNPYSPDEQRVAEFFCEAGIGGGDDPIGSLIASHQSLADERNALKRQLNMEPGSYARMFPEDEDDQSIQQDHGGG